MKLSWIWNGLTVSLSFCINFGLVLFSVDCFYFFWNFVDIFPETKQQIDQYANFILSFTNLPQSGMCRELVVTATLLLSFGLLAAFVFPYFPILRHILYMLQGQCAVPPLEKKVFLDPALSILQSRRLPTNSYRYFIKYDNDYNAFASGAHDITIHANLLRNFTAPELAGIIAHEMGHHVNGDVTSINICNGFNFLSCVCIRFLNMVIFVLNLFRFIPFLGLLCVLMAWALFIVVSAYSWLIEFPSHLFDLLFSRRVEFGADAYAAKTGLASELIEGLRHLQKLYGDTPWFMIPFVDHPRTKARIQKLEQFLSK